MSAAMSLICRWTEMILQTSNLIGLPTTILVICTFAKVGISSTYLKFEAICDNS
jgi:hypothetical protein